MPYLQQEEDPNPNDAMKMSTTEIVSDNQTLYKFSYKQQLALYALFNKCSAADCFQGLENILYIEGSCAETNVSPMYKIDVTFNNSKVGTKT
jgi:hypothetical protein